MEKRQEAFKKAMYFCFSKSRASRQIHKVRLSQPQLHIPESESESESETESESEWNFKKKLEHSQSVPELLTLANELIFIGPFPKPVDDEVFYTGTNSTSDGYERLSDFILYASSRVDIRNRYTLKALNEHTFHVENFAHLLCFSFGELDELFKSKYIIRRGSSYELTKILAPDEYDFIPVLQWSDDEAVRVENVGEDCELAGQGYGDILIEQGHLHMALWSFPAEDLTESKQGPAKLKTTFETNIYLSLQSLLNKIKDYKFIGMRNHEEDPESPYELGSLSMHTISHGTSIWLRLGAPLCTVDIDLSFAIEKMDQTEGRYVMLSRMNPCDTCDENSHWTESLIDQGLKTEQIIHVLSIQHRKLFLLFKYIHHLVSTDLKLHTDGSSYVFKMLLLHHQETCQRDNVGQCFEDIIREFFVKDPECTENIENKTSVYISVDNREVKDIHYHKRPLLMNFRIDSFVMLWILEQVKHSTDATWWGTLVRIDQKLTEANADDTKRFNSLIDTAQKVQTFCKDYEQEEGSVLELEWAQDDGTRTLIKYVKPSDSDSVKEFWQKIFQDNPDIMDG